MAALEVERRIAEGEQALQGLIKFAREHAGKLEAHEAEQGIVTRRRPMGLAARKRYFARRGTGDVGPAITRADGGLLTRETPLRGRDDCSLFGTFAGARTCDRPAGEPGSLPLDAQVNRPERCDSYCLHEWMTVVAVEHPVKERAGFFAQLFALEGAASVLMEVAKEAPAASDSFDAQKPVPREETAGALLMVRVDGPGVPLIQAEAVKLKATLGTGEKRQQQKEALVGVSYTVEAKPRSPEARAALLVDPDAPRARRRRADTRDEAPRAQQVRRLARLVRTKPQVMERRKADAERRAPQHRQPLVSRRAGARCWWRLATQLFQAWRHRRFVRAILHVVGYLWSAANALCGEPSTAGKRWVQQKLTAILRGRVGDVIGGRRHILTQPRRRQSVRETLGNVITFLHNHRRWRPYDASLAAGLPVGTGVVEISQL